MVPPWDEKNPPMSGYFPLIASPQCTMLRLKTQQMDNLIQWARQTIDLNNYFADNLALVRAGQSINAAAFTNEVTNRSKAVQVLLNEINSLTEQITQLSDSLQ